MSPDDTNAPVTSARWRRGLFAGAATRGPHARTWLQRHWTSRALQRIGEVVSHSGAGVLAAVGVVAWCGLGLAVGFPHWWEVVLYTVTSSVTFVMVFVIQHTNTRQTAATQRKLDELVRSTPRADDRLIAAEEAPDHVLQALADADVAHRERIEADG